MQGATGQRAGSAYFGSAGLAEQGWARPAAQPPPPSHPSPFPSSRAHLWDRTPAGPVTTVDLQNLRLHLRLAPGVWPLLQRLQREQGGSGGTVLHARLAPNGGSSTTRGPLHLELLAGAAPPRSAAVPVRFGPPADGADSSVEAQRLASALEVASSCAPSPAGLGNLLCARLTCRAPPDGSSGLVFEGACATAAPIVDFKPLLAKRVAPTPRAQRLQGLLRGGGGAAAPASFEDGLLSMDRGRALVPLEASDGAAYSVPLVGCWAAAANANIRHPLVAAACLRFLCSRALADKATAPGASFLLLLYACGSAAVPACYEVHVALDPATGGLPLLAHRLAARWRPGQDEGGGAAACTAEPCPAIALPALPVALGSRQPAAAAHVTAPAAAACYSGLAARVAPAAPASSTESRGALPSSARLPPPQQLFYTPPAPQPSGQPAWPSPPSACWPPVRLEPSPWQAASSGGQQAEANEGAAAASEACAADAWAAAPADAAAAAAMEDEPAEEAAVPVPDSCLSEGDVEDACDDDAASCSGACSEGSPPAAGQPQQGSEAAELGSPPSLETWHTSSASFVFESPRKAALAPMAASHSATAAAAPSSAVSPAMPDAAPAELQPLQLLLALQQALGTLPVAAQMPQQGGGDVSGEVARLQGEVRALRLEVAELRDLVQALQPAPPALVPAPEQPQQLACDDDAPGADTGPAAHASALAQPAAAPASVAPGGSLQPQQRQPWQEAEAAIDEMLVACEASTGLAAGSAAVPAQQAAVVEPPALEEQAAVVEPTPLQDPEDQLPVEEEADGEHLETAAQQPSPARDAPPLFATAEAAVTSRPAGAAVAKLAAAASFAYGKAGGEEDATSSSDDEEDWLLMAKYNLAAPLGGRSSAARHRGRRTSVD